MMSLKLFGYSNGGMTKKEISNVLRSRVRLIDIPVHRNGFVCSGRQPDGKFLVGILFDAWKDKQVPLSALHPILSDTFTARSCHGGLHSYVYIATSPYFFLDIKNENKLVTWQPDIEYIDIRADGGIIIAPGTDLIDAIGNHHPYTIIIDKPIKTIAPEEYLEVMAYYNCQNKPIAITSPNEYSSYYQSVPDDAKPENDRDDDDSLTLPPFDSSDDTFDYEG